MEEWKDGRVEEWKNGRMEGWKDGRVEGWKDGRMEAFKALNTVPGNERTFGRDQVQCWGLHRVPRLRVTAALLCQ